MDSLYASVKEKEKEREREKEREKEKDKEREREMEMEAALYTNCLLLGLDASILGQGGMPRSGLFRHSNPRMGENLLYFLLSALRGPAQSAKDFAGVWPIFDAGQSRDFRKIVQNLINELEAQGALPRSNSRVSSLATCCGPRFVELLWQLSAHALREVHKRSFPADVSANPLPPSLTEIVAQTNHASALLTVTKARIAIERRRFIDGATAAVRRQALWSNLAHDMTAEYRALCAEEAYLHQELDKLQEPRSQRDSQASEITPGTLKSISVSRASQLWESILKQTVQHERLASGPIEDLIAHREHRYRVSGPALKAALDKSTGALSNEFSNLTSQESPCNIAVSNDADISLSIKASDVSDDNQSRNDEKSAKGSSSVDVAEILRRWTHSLQRIHRQTVRLARSNDGTGPDLIRETWEDGDNSHAQALRATLAEHKQHLGNIQLLISQLRESMPSMEKSIANLREQLSRTSPLMIAPSISSPLTEVLPSTREASGGQVSEIKPRPSNLELIPPSPALKLPPIFSLSPGKLPNSQKVGVSTYRSVDMPRSDALAHQDPVQSMIREQNKVMKNDDIISLRQAVREAALSQNNSMKTVKCERPECAVEHFFTPVEPFVKEEAELGIPSSATNKQSLRPSQEYYRYDVVVSAERSNGYDQHILNEQDVSEKQARTSKPTNKCLSYDDILQNEKYPELQEPNDKAEVIAEELPCPFSPPLLTELSSFTDTYDDLLGTEDFELSDVALEGVWFNPAM